MTFTSQKNKDIVRRLQKKLYELKRTRKTIGKFDIESDLMIFELTEIITPPKRDQYGDRITSRLKSEDK